MVEVDTDRLVKIPEKSVKLTKPPGEFFWLSKMRDRQFIPNVDVV
ncbi:MAG: hypothetical protein V7K48_32860 [Nostoc sp.]